MNTTIRDCLKGASIRTDGDETTYTVRHDLTSRDHYPTKRAMTDNFCKVVCSDSERKVCRILGNTK